VARHAQRISEACVGRHRPHRRLDGYSGLRGAGYDHRPIKQRSRRADRQIALPLARRATSNLKTWLGATHRGVSPDDLPVYLDRFVFRHNHRTPLAGFQTLLGLGTLHDQRPTTGSLAERHDPKRS
jgi:hypothetical protein